MLPEGLLFTKDHEWIKVDNDIATIGITGYAAEELGEIVFAELPEVGTEVSQEDEFGTIESVKTVSSLYMPASGVIEKVNTEAQENPAIIGESPYEEGWLVQVELNNEDELSDLMDKEAYQEYIDSL